MLQNIPKSQKGLFSFRISKKLYIVKKKNTKRKHIILSTIIETFNYSVRINKT